MTTDHSADAARMRFDGAIAGLGTTSGTRLMIGMWPISPFGPIVDVMIERSDGRRLLIAPSDEVGEFIASTYHFDEVRIEPTSMRADEPTWSVRAGSLTVSFEVGRRTAIGQLLSLVPRPLARARWWCRAIDPLASRLRRGVHTVGTAGNGRTEYYCALDEQRLRAATARLDDVGLGALAPIEPPVRFGFSSTPIRPSIVRVTTLIDG